MPNPPTITYPLILSKAQLGVMLTLFEISDTIGLESPFSADPSDRSALLERGKAELEAAGWLVWNTEQQNYHLDERLIAITLAITFPKVVIQFIMSAPGAPAQGVTCMIGQDLVLEVAMINSDYHINVLVSTDLLAQRIIHTLSLPDQVETEAVGYLSHSDFAALQAEPDRVDTIAPLFTKMFTHAHTQANISLLQIQALQIVQQQMFGIITGTNHEAWLILPHTSDQLQISTINSQSLHKILLDSIHSLHPSVS
ncbi:hypothetical protein [Candidatus Oscillochloris fontis]|uniref:hypothetical protein n=1 Tax=Candidatus Oscillochloris fontis TaxID=2496868 RepID=UPI00101B71A0|nr:hypothetical protein [Candidatus Oscillochloris fontis]